MIDGLEVFDRARDAAKVAQDEKVVDVAHVDELRLAQVRASGLLHVHLQHIDIGARVGHVRLAKQRVGVVGRKRIVAAYRDDGEL